jgi:hypothetical protein
MSHIIQDFQHWKKVNEADDAPSRERERGTISNKVVAIPVDKTTLKLKIVNDADVIDANGKLTTDGFKALLVWVKAQKPIITYYPGLNDLVKNIVIYTVAKDNDRKQVVLFKIYSKEELKQQDPKAVGINGAVQFIRQDELTQALGGTLLNATGGDASKLGSANTPVAGELILPVKSGAILNSTSAPLIKFITGAYNKVKAKLAGNPIVPKVKAEILADKLGASSQTFVKALNAGYGILDTKLAEDTEVDITQTLSDKLANPDELNIDMFNKVAPLSTPVSTGDIKVPADGFREGLQDDTEMAKFQNLLKAKFKNKLANHEAYQKFVKAGEKGFTGNYGPLTRSLVALLKSKLTPKYENTDGRTIEPLFVSIVQAVKESRSEYLALDGVTLITEVDASEYSFGDFSDTASTSTSKASSSTSGKSTKKSQIAAKPDNFDVKAFQTWVIDTKKESGWVKGKDDDGSWGPKTAGVYSKYKDTYKPVKKIASVTGNEVDDAFLKLGRDIKAYIETPDKFDSYSGTSSLGMDDDEQGAWDKMVMYQWKKVFSPALELIKPKVDALSDEDQKKRALSNYNLVRRMFLGKDGKDSNFKLTFLGGQSTDTYWMKISLIGSADVKTIKINCDF